MGPDGRTPEQRATGRRSHQHAANFREQVWWRPLHPGPKPPALHPRAESGFYVGPVEGTNEVYILTPTGAVRTRTFSEGRPVKDGIVHCSLSKYL